MLDGKVGTAYCAVNPEDGVVIYYTVCAYHGGQTDLDWVAALFIANGSSECCQWGMCDEGVLGPGVIATFSLSLPNSNNFSVPACQVHSKTASSSFVCLAHRELNGSGFIKGASPCTVSLSTSTSPPAATSKPDPTVSVHISDCSVSCTVCCNRVSHLLHNNIMQVEGRKQEQAYWNQWKRHT